MAEKESARSGGSPDEREKSSSRPTYQSGSNHSSAPNDPPSLEEARRMLDFVAPRPHDIRKDVAFALYDGWGDAAESLFLEWVASHPEHNAEREHEAKSVWRSAKTPGKITWKKLRWLAKQGGYRPDPNVTKPPPLTAEERQRREREKAEREAREQTKANWRRDKAALEAVSRVSQGRPAGPTQPYVLNKGVKPYGWLRQDGKALLVPAEDVSGRVWSYQVITEDGEKRFQRGGSVSGLMFPTGPEPTDKLYIVEGLATGLSVHEATAAPVFVAFNAGNLKAVALALRERYPGTEIIFAADNGQWTPGNPGLVKASAAAQAVGGRVVCPRFKDTTTKPKDFNDLHQLEGLDEARRQLEAPAPTAADSEEEEPEDSAHSKEGKPPKVTNLTLLLQMAEAAELFHDAEGNGYAVFQEGEHWQIWPLLSGGFRDWLLRRFYELTGRGVNGQTMKDALATLEAKARFDGPERAVFLRVARLADSILIDLCDDEWRTIEVTDYGWKVLARPPVAFVRRSGMAALPLPVAGGSIAELRPFLNLRGTDFVLIVAWLLAGLGGRGPFPVLVLQAEQGAGKSTASRLLRSLVDPSDVPLKAPPKTADDLAIAAFNAYLLALDNLSGINHEMSDTLCRLSTGAGISKRRLYSDLEEIQIHLTRLILLNGIDDIPTRPDLADRSIIVNLPALPAERRRKEADFWAAFEQARPRIFGALLSGLAGGLRDESGVRLERPPRLADFAAWATATESAMGWKPGTFITAYQKNIEQAAALGIEASPVGVALVAFLYASPHQAHTMTGTLLMNQLATHAPEWARKSTAWPKGPRGLKDSIRRLSAPLRQIGIVVSEFKDREGRWIKLELQERREDIQRSITGTANANAQPEEVVF
jgi:phage/plasmid primase-like uncharacterized protein